MEDEKEVEEMIQKQGLNAPRLSPEKIDAVIIGKTFTKLPSGKCMICEITLQNGHTVRGEAACVSPENFDQEIGEKVSFEDARNKIWQLEGYLLQEKHPVAPVAKEYLPHQIRVINEASVLAQELCALRLFIADDYKFLEMCSSEEQAHMLNQELSMSGYLRVLGKRIAAFE